MSLLTDRCLDSLRRRLAPGAGPSEPIAKFHSPESPFIQGIDRLQAGLPNPMPRCVNVQRKQTHFRHMGRSLPAPLGYWEGLRCRGPRIARRTVLHMPHHALNPLQLEVFRVPVGIPHIDSARNGLTGHGLSWLERMA